MGLISIGVPISIRACATGRVGVNATLGIRTQYLMASPAAWKAGHKAALPPIYIASALALVAVLVSFVPAFSIVTRLTLAIAAAVAILVGMLISVPMANRAALDVIALEQNE